MSETSAESFYNLGGARLAAGDFAGAVCAYEAAVPLAPHVAGLFNNLGIALLNCGRFDEARAAFERALVLQPRYARAAVNLGKVLGAQGRATDAQVHLRAVLAIDPNYLPALINLGEMQGATADYDAAVQTLRHAVALAPASAEARRALGMAQSRVGQTYDAIDTLRCAIALDPLSATSHLSLAHVLLAQGEWRDAWPHFEFRLHIHGADPAALPDAARWDGSESNAGALWLVGEQGLGDQIQFVRYARLLAQQHPRCVACVDSRLVHLLARAGAGVPVLPFGARFDASRDRWLPLLSTPLWHRTEPSTVPFAAGYLRADATDIAAWRARLPPRQRLRVALAWRGNPATETGWFAGRSPPLSALEPLWALDGVEFLSLQKGPEAAQLRDGPLRRHLLDIGEFDVGPDAFVDSAAILGCVDLLITSDSALAHLAGALGVECWVCLKAHADWRWLQDGSGSPWYDSARLYRQAHGGDWSGVFWRVADDLKRRLATAATAGHAPSVDRMAAYRG